MEIPGLDIQDPAIPIGCSPTCLLDDESQWIAFVHQAQFALGMG